MKKVIKRGDIMSLIDRVSHELSAEGLSVTNEGGTLIANRQDVPGINAFISTDDEENIVICSANIVDVNAIPENNRGELFEKLLEASPSLPLSSIGISDGHIVIYGQLVGDSVANVVTEVEFLFDSIVEIVPVIKEYL